MRRPLEALKCESRGSVKESRNSKPFPGAAGSSLPGTTRAGTNWPYETPSTSEKGPIPPAMWQSLPIPAVPGEKYTLTAKIKTTSATGENAVQILYLSGPGWGWKGGPSSQTITGTHDWQTVTITGTVPEDADVVRVNCVSKGKTGAVLFDDLKLTRLQNE